MAQVNTPSEIPGVNNPANPQAQDNPLAIQAIQSMMTSDLTSYRNATGLDSSQQAQKEVNWAELDANEIYNSANTFASAGKATDGATLSANEDNLAFEYADISKVISDMENTAVTSNDLITTTLINNAISDASSARARAGYAMESDQEKLKLVSR